MAYKVLIWRACTLPQNWTWSDVVYWTYDHTAAVQHCSVVQHHVTALQDVERTWNHLSLAVQAIFFTWVQLPFDSLRQIQTLLTRDFFLNQIKSGLSNIIKTQFCHRSNNFSILFQRWRGQHERIQLYGKPVDLQGTTGVLDGGPLSSKHYEEHHFTCNITSIYRCQTIMFLATVPFYPLLSLYKIFFHKSIKNKRISPLGCVSVWILVKWGPLA